MNKITFFLLFIIVSTYSQQSQLLKIIGKELAVSDSLTLPKLTVASEKLISRYLYKNYPPLAKRSGVSGKVQIKFICSKEGNISNPQIVKEKPKDMGFGKVAKNASKLLKYKPAKLNNIPVEVEIKQAIYFRTGFFEKLNNKYIYAPTYRLREF